MARIRQIKPDFYLDDDLALCSREARLMFPGLWMLADRAGRLEDRPARIKAQIFPYDQDIGSGEVENFLEQLTAHGFIIRYQAAGKNLIQIRTFEKHQHCHLKEPDSQLPPPENAAPIPASPEKTGQAWKKPGEYGASTGLAPVSPGKNRASTVRGESIDKQSTFTKPGASPEKTGQEPVLHRSSPSAFTSTYINGCLSVGVGFTSGVAESGVIPRERIEPHALEKSAEKQTTHTPASAFFLTDQLRSWAEVNAPDVDPEIETEKFRDYYGRNGTTFADLSAAWRKWVRDAVERRARAPTGRRESAGDHNARIFAEIEAMDEIEMRVLQGLDPERRRT